jgi:hypothetical protein
MSKSRPPASGATFNVAINRFRLTVYSTRRRTTQSRERAVQNVHNKKKRGRLRPGGLSVGYGGRTRLGESLLQKLRSSDAQAPAPTGRHRPIGSRKRTDQQTYPVPQVGQGAWQAPRTVRGVDVTHPESVRIRLCARPFKRVKRSYPRRGGLVKGCLKLRYSFSISAWIRRLESHGASSV